MNIKDIKNQAKNKVCGLKEKLFSSSKEDDGATTKEKILNKYTKAVNIGLAVTAVAAAAVVCYKVYGGSNSDTLDISVAEVQ